MKKWAKILAFMGVMVIGLSAGLAGCATTSNINNSESEIIYNGATAVNVDGYLYFGNALASVDDITSSSTYSTNAALSYLARVNTNSITQTSKDHSPSSVSKVSTEVTAYENSFMFVLGSYIYYATPFTQEIKVDGEVSHYYEYTTIYRSKLNGDSKKKLYSTTSEITQIEALKDPSSGTYYIVIFAGDELISINLSTSKSTVLADSVTSVAIPETYNSADTNTSLSFNGLIYYTATPENELGNTNTRVFSVSLSGEVNNYGSGTTDISFVERVNDVLIYTAGSQSSVFMIDVSNGGFSTVSESGAFYTTDTSLSDFHLIKDPDAGIDVGYIFLYGSTLSYASVESMTSASGATSSFKIKKNYGTITIKVDGTELSDYEIFAVKGRTVYLATSTGIYSVKLTNAMFNSSGDVTIEGDDEHHDVTTIVTMTAIEGAEYIAFDGTYIYYYAQLESLATDSSDDEEDEDEDSDDSDSTTTEEDDENYYLYRVRASGNGSYQLLSYTTISSRHTTA